MKNLITLCFVLGTLAIGSMGIAQNQIYYTKPDSIDPIVEWGANDLKMWLEKSTGQTWTVQEHTGGPLPTSGIVLHTDTVGMLYSQRPQYCEITGNGTDYLYFQARHARGILFGLNQWMHDIGFRFYQPGNNWNVVPSLTSPYTTLTGTVIKETSVSAHNWINSGSAPENIIDTLKRQTKGHQEHIFRNTWSTEYEGFGHNALDSTYIAQINSSGCMKVEVDSAIIEAGYNGTHYNPAPNMFNSAAVDAYAQLIVRSQNAVQTLALIEDGIYGYMYNHNDPAYSGMCSVETEDGTRFGNTNSLGCALPNPEWPTPSEQYFSILNTTIDTLVNRFPNIHQFNTFAYSETADTPSVSIHPKLSVAIASAFQSAGSVLSLMNRWKTKLGENTDQLMQYYYGNLTYSGQQPYFDRIATESALKRTVNWKTGGFLLEAAYGKFTTMADIQIWNEYLKDTTKNMESLRNEFYTLMFGAGAPKVKELMDAWANTTKHTSSNWLFDNKHRFNYYLNLINDADNAVLASDTAVKKRLIELKAYAHYLVLDTKFWEVNKMDSSATRIVVDEVEDFMLRSHHYDILSTPGMMFHYLNSMVSTSLGVAASSTGQDTIPDPDLYHFYCNLTFKWMPFFVPYINFAGDTVVNPYFTDPLGSELQNTRPYLYSYTNHTDAEIDALFQADLSEFSLDLGYHFAENYDELIAKIGEKSLGNMDTVHYNLNLGYAGQGNSFWLYTDVATEVTINYDNLHGGGAKYVIGMSSEDEMYNSEFQILSSEGVSGELHFILPAAGHYNLSFVGQTTGGWDFSIVTNDAVMYRRVPLETQLFGEALPDVPKFYVPEGTNRVYLTMFDRSPSVTLLADINNYIEIRKPNGDEVEIFEEDDDLLYFEVDDADDAFWSYVTPTANLYLSFSNITNAFFWLDSINRMAVNEHENYSYIVSPNPTNGIVKVDFPNGKDILSLEVLDLFGREIVSKNLQKGSLHTELDLSSLSNGMYLITATDGLGKKHPKRIILN